MAIQLLLEWREAPKPSSEYRQRLTKKPECKARKLDLLHAAASECDLRVLSGNRFERLQGKLTGWCSIRVNKQYRLIFKWRAGKAFDVYLDPHTYQ